MALRYRVKHGIVLEDASREHLRASTRMGAGRAASWLVSRARQGRVLVRLGMRHSSAGAGTWACQVQLLTSGRKYAVRAWGVSGAPFIGV